MSDKEGIYKYQNIFLNNETFELTQAIVLGQYKLHYAW